MGWGLPHTPTVAMAGLHALWSAEFVIKDINPEPWTPGTISTGKKNGKTFGRMTKDGGLLAYQQAIREWFKLNHPDLIHRHAAYYTTVPVSLEFRLWRQRAQYQGPSGRMVRKSQADATNLQKALEDALGEGTINGERVPGILFKNDNQVQDIRTVIEEQGYDTDSKIIIRIKYHPTKE